MAADLAPWWRRRDGQMGLPLLSDVLEDCSKYELDDSVYLPQGVRPSLDAPVNVLPFDRLRKRTFQDQEYLLGIEQIRDVIEGLEAQLGRPTHLEERLRAVVHYAQYDAFIDPKSAKTK
jgi:hypothetical protein